MKIVEKTAWSNEFDVAVSTFLNDDINRGCMIDAENMAWCQYRLVKAIKEPAKYLTNRTDMKTLAVRKKWELAIETALVYPVLSHSYWAIDNNLNLGARVDLCFMANGSKTPFKAYWVSPEDIKIAQKDNTIKKGHLASMCSILHLLDFDRGLVVYDSFYEHVVFEVRRTQAACAAIVKKCQEVMGHILAGTTPDPCGKCEFCKKHLEGTSERSKNEKSSD